MVVEKRSLSIDEAYSKLRLASSFFLFANLRTDYFRISSIRIVKHAVSFFTANRHKSKLSQCDFAILTQIWLFVVN
jgi:hypothetical protein